MYLVSIRSHFFVAQLLLTFCMNLLPFFASCRVSSYVVIDVNKVIRTILSTPSIASSVTRGTEKKFYKPYAFGTLWFFFFCCFTEPCIKYKNVATNSALSRVCAVRSLPAPFTLHSRGLQFAGLYDSVLTLFYTRPPVTSCVWCARRICVARSVRHVCVHLLREFA